MKLWQLCSLIMLSGLFACSEHSTTSIDVDPSAIAWGDANVLQMGLHILPTTQPIPVPNQYELCLRNISGSPIWIVRPPDELTNEQLMPTERADALLLTLQFRTDSGLMRFGMTDPQKPQVMQLKPGELVVVKMDLSLDLKLHPGLNRVAFCAYYSNNDPKNHQLSDIQAWTGTIRSPEFGTMFEQQ